MTSASILNITPEDLPFHEINIVGVGTAIESVVVSDIGIQVECIIYDYVSKDKPVELQMTLFHPPGSRFTSQTTTVKRGSTMFFSGSLTLIEDKLYLELHNFSFIRINQTLASTSAKQLPWSSKSTDNPTNNIAQTIHKLKKSKDSVTQNTTITQKSNSKKQTSTPPFSVPTTPKTSRNTNKTQQQPTPLTPAKRKTRSSSRINNKAQKLSDIASNIIDIADSGAENDDNVEDPEVEAEEVKDSEDEKTK